ncbi:HD domain-containing protein [uncultured Ruminococcus sp.]|uniref:HD domain-containing protein n=1 Tax=uncultured Ruminococcus sp. TaxID=165186 RepID=UPI0025E539A5|nr:HD domain-containing protein [uncultured Ruminococcus sp.]
MLKAICSRKELTANSYYDCVKDIIGCQQVQELRSITHHISTTRFQHCVNVSYYSYMVCRKFNLNARSAARAGLLHDLFYYDRKQYNSEKTKGQASHSENHAMLACANAAEITKISKLERDMIEKHMWPVTRPMPKYKETYIITIIDKYCAVLEFCVPKVQRIVHRKPQ